MKNTKKERIRTLIGGMGDDEFERFMSDLLPTIYPEFESLEPSFNFIGKTTKGKCDSHVYHKHNDTYTAIICTTQQSNIVSKVLDDINKLMLTKFASKICRVLLCVNTPLKDEIEAYRDACNERGWELVPLSLERITNYVLGETELLMTYFGEVSPNTITSSPIVRRFDCGDRVQEARKDLSLSVSRLIEDIDFPSEKEWCAIEDKQLEISEKYILSLSALTGISVNWLKHKISNKYPSERIYDDQSTKIESIASENPIRAFMTIEPEDMDILLIVQFTEFRWRVYSFGFSMDFWNWVGDEHHIPTIFELLKTIDRHLNHPHSLIISKKTTEELRSGNVHPSIAFKNTKGYSYWFDDLFNLYHKNPIAKDQYRHYGEWFVKLQNEFRRYVKKEPHQ